MPRVPSSAVPAPQVASSISTFLSGTPVVYPAISTGDTANYSTYLNDISARAEAAARYAVGGNCVLSGLTLSSSGLTITVATGMAFIDGVVKLTSSDTRTKTVLASQSVAWLWLRQDKSIEVKYDTSIPSGSVVCLGKVSTDVSGVTDTQYDGVIYANGGSLYRTTYDDFAPTDSPGSTIRLISKSNFGTYYWDGSSWLEITRNASSPVWRKYTVGYADLQAAALSKAFNIIQLPAKSVIHGAVISIDTAFAGTSISAMTISVGKTGTVTAYIGATNSLATGRATTSTVAFESASATTQVLVNAISTGANLSALTQGSASVWVCHSVLP